MSEEQNKQLPKQEEVSRVEVQAVADSVPSDVACIVCGYSPGRQIPAQCPVCHVDRAYFLPV